MTKDVWITVIASQSGEDGNGELLKVVTPGTYYCRNKKHFLLYDEIDEESGGVTQNKIKVSSAEVEVAKKGYVTTTMLFKDKSRSVAVYGTSFGTLTMGIMTRAIQFLQEEAKLTIRMEYTLDLNERRYADCSMRIEVQPRKNPLHLSE